MHDSFHIGVKALIINPDQNVLLLERLHPLKRIYWDLPGGRMHQGESLLDTLKREVKEEIGLDNFDEIIPYSMFLSDIRIPVLNESVGLVFSIFQCKITIPFQPVLSEEHVNYAWFPLHEAIKKLNYPTDAFSKVI